MIDVRTYGAVPDGTTDSSAAINAALLVGDIIIQNGVFSIASSIKIPSNRTVYGKNCLLKLADNAYDSFFRNSDYINGNSNINILGLGNFAMDCNGATNKDNPLNSTYDKRGVNSHKYLGISLYKVTTFRIENIHVLDFMRHCIHICNSSYGTIKDYNVNVKTGMGNQDGLDLHWGCHHITIDGMRGWTLDDFIDVIAGNLTDYSPYFNTGDTMVGDIHDITFNNIEVKNSQAGRCPAIITGYGNKMYNIAFSNIKLRKSGSLFYNNYVNFYDGDIPPNPSKEDVYDFIFDNCEVNALFFDTAVFTFGQSIKNFTATNITNNSGEDMWQLVDGDQSDNVKINGVQVS